MRLLIDLEGDVQIDRELLRFSGRLENAKPAFEEIADQLRQNESEQFRTGGQHASGGWQPLAESTILRKLQDADPTVRANAGRPLLATERLVKSLTGGDSGDHVSRAERDQLTFGTKVPYARFHQLGEGVPRRRPLEVSETDRRDMVRTLQRFMVGELA